MKFQCVPQRARATLRSSQPQKTWEGIKMFLGKLKVKARGYVSGFSTKEIPKPLEREELNRLVIALGENANEVKKKLILAHLGLALQIVGRYVAHYPAKTDDLVGVAMLSVSTSVDKFDTIKRDNNITGYIVTCLHGHLTNFIKEDKTVKVSWRETEKQVAAFKETGVKNRTHTFSIDHCLYNDEISTGTRDLILNAITSNDYHASDIELQEVIEKVGFSHYEHIVFVGLMSGEDETTIAKRVGRSRQSVNLVKKAVRTKLEPYYSEQLERGYLELNWE